MRNRSAVSADEQQILQNARVTVLGCGGLGGYVIEALARIGVGHLTVVDGDVFQPSNLNRQLLSCEGNLGRSKAEQAKKRVSEINSNICVKAMKLYADGNNVDELVADADVVIDALDNAEARLLAYRAASARGIPFVHGAISGWRARIHTAMPGDKMLEFICGGQAVDDTAGNLVFSAAWCASVEAAEAVKLILGRGTVSDTHLVECDLLNLTFDIIKL